jgi:hypothetical protein
MSANVLVMQNIPYREGYRYVCVIIDHAAAASKTLCWVFPSKTCDESDPTTLVFLQKVMKEILPSLTQHTTRSDSFTHAFLIIKSGSLNQSHIIRP